MTPYFVPPPIIGSVYKYQNVNKDKSMRDYVVKYFITKLQKWINEKYYDEIKEKFLIKNNQVIFDKNNKNKLNNNNDIKLINEHILQQYYDYRTIYKLLKHYAKKHKLKWWDLRKNKNYIKIYFFKYLKNKLIISNNFSTE
jgi:hypothetical protein